MLRSIHRSLFFTRGRRNLNDSEYAVFLPEFQNYPFLKEIRSVFLQETKKHNKPNPSGMKIVDLHNLVFIVDWLLFHVTKDNSDIDFTPLSVCTEKEVDALLKKVEILREIKHSRDLEDKVRHDLIEWTLVEYLYKRLAQMRSNVSEGHHTELTAGYSPSTTEQATKTKEEKKKLLDNVSTEIFKHPDLVGYLKRKMLFAEEGEISIIETVDKSLKTAHAPGFDDLVAAAEELVDKLSVAQHYKIKIAELNSVHADGRPEDHDIRARFYKLYLLVAEMQQKLLVESPLHKAGSAPALACLEDNAGIHPSPSCPVLSEELLRAAIPVIPRFNNEIKDLKFSKQHSQLVATVTKTLPTMKIASLTSDEKLRISALGLMDYTFTSSLFNAKSTARLTTSLELISEINDVANTGKGGKTLYDKLQQQKAALTEQSEQRNVLVKLFVGKLRLLTTIEDTIDRMDDFKKHDPHFKVLLETEPKPSAASPPRSANASPHP